MTKRFFVSRAVATALFLWGLTPAFPAKAAEVLIYYANETAPDEREAQNFAEFQNFLRPLDAPKAAESIRLMEADRRDFPAAVDSEIDQIFKGLRYAEIPVCAAVFTNRLVRAGTFWWACSQPESWKEGKITPISDENFILVSNPLSNPATLDLAFSQVAELFPPKQNSFIFVSKSHGSVAMALMPRLRMRFADVDQGEILSRLAAQSKKAVEADLPEVVRRVGVTKKQFADALARASTYDLHFRIVFAESCLSSLPGDPADWELPRNVDTLFISKERFAPYHSLDYEKVFSVTHQQQDTVVARISDQLSEHFTRVESRPRYGIGMFFIGVGMLLGSLTLVTRRKS